MIRAGAVLARRNRRARAAPFYSKEMVCGGSSHRRTEADTFIKPELPAIRPVISLYIFPGRLLPGRLRQGWPHPGRPPVGAGLSDAGSPGEEPALKWYKSCL